MDRLALVVPVVLAIFTSGCNVWEDDGYRRKLDVVVLCAGSECAASGILDATIRDCSNGELVESRRVAMASLESGLAMRMIEGGDTFFACADAWLDVDEDGAKGPGDIVASTPPMEILVTAELYVQELVFALDTTVSDADRSTVVAQVTCAPAICFTESPAPLLAEVRTSATGEAATAYDFYSFARLTNDEPIVVSISNVPPGDVFLRVYLDVDESGSVSSGDLVVTSSNGSIAMTTTAGTRTDVVAEIDGVAP